MGLAADRIYWGDCMDFMQGIADGSIDMILSDMPYGTTRCKWDTMVDLKCLWEEYLRIIKPNGAICLFAQAPFDKVLACSNLKYFRYEWVWEKTNATGFLNASRMPMKCHEHILVFYVRQPKYHPQKTEGHAPVNSFYNRKNTCAIYGSSRPISGGGETKRFPRDILRFASDKQNSHLHPTQKPLALCEYLIRTYTDAGDIVLDSFLGSGTTALASKISGRRYIGIEKERTFFETAVQRWHFFGEKEMNKNQEEVFGLWGRMRLDFLKKEKPKIYRLMEENNSLQGYLENYQQTFQIRAEHVLNDLRKERGITKELQQSDPFEWILRDAHAMSDVVEIVRKEIQK